jgi:hypothetical protein
MWSDEMVLILRNIINDDGTTQTYTDNRLMESLLAAAQIVTFEVSFPTSYLVDFDAYQISPDPTDTAGGTRDNAFIALVTTKAACRIARGEAKIAGGQGISVKDGSSAVDLRDVAKYKIQTATSFCQDYKDMKWEYETNGSSSFSFITGPYRVAYGGNLGREGGFR